jgi:hypothetical protein
VNTKRRWSYVCDSWGIVGVLLLLLAAVFSSRGLYEAAALLLVSAFAIQLSRWLLDSSEERALLAVVTILLFPSTLLAGISFLVRSNELLVISAWLQGATESVYLVLVAVGLLQDRADLTHDAKILSGTRTDKRWFRACGKGEYSAAFGTLIGKITGGEASSVGSWLEQPTSRLPGLPNWPVSCNIQSALVSLQHASQEWQRPPITAADPKLAKLVLVGLESATLSLADMAARVRRAEAMGPDPAAPQFAAALDRIATAADRIVVAGNRASELGHIANDRSASAVLGVSDLASVGDEVTSLISALEVVWQESG